MTNLTFALQKKSWFNRLSLWLFLAFGDTKWTVSPDDQQEDLLVSRAVKDPQAFDNLYRRYVDRVYIYHLARIGSREEAEDLTSQTFLAALEGIAGYRRQCSFAAWLFSIARRKLVDHYRRPKHVPLELAKNTYSSLEEAVDRRMTIQQINRALLKLAPDRVDAVCLRIFGQLSAAETGQILSKSEGAVRTMVYRALQDLRQCLPVSVEIEDV